MDDFLSYIDTVIAVYFLNLVNCYNIRTVNAQEFVRWQHLLDSLHGQMRNQRFLLSVKIEQYIISHAIDVSNLINGDVPPFSINPDEDGIELLFRLYGCLLDIKYLSCLLY